MSDDNQTSVSIGSSLLSIRKDSRQLYASPRFSDIVNNSENNSTKRGFSAVSKKILQKRNVPRNEFTVREVEQNGKKSIKSLSGLKRDSEIIYVQNERPHIKDVFDQQGHLERSISEPGFLNAQDIPQNGSIFDRPGFGSVAFRNSMCGTLFSIPPSEIREEEEEEEEEEDSIGSAGSLARRNKQLPWDADQLDLDDKEELDLTSLINFLSSRGLSEYIPIFTKEKIDLDTLYILTEEDLKTLGLPFGPRKKLYKALQENKQKTDDPEEVFVSYL